MEEHIGPII